MENVKQLLQAKGTSIWSVAPETSVFDALNLMAEKNIGALLVIDNGRLAGIFSERDYARKIILRGKTSRETAVKEIMTEKVVSVHSDQSIDECMELMTSKHIRHLPVVDGDQIRGVVSIGDIVKSVIAKQQSTIHHLEDYITGRR